MPLQFSHRLTHTHSSFPMRGGSRLHAERLAHPRAPGQLQLMLPTKNSDAFQQRKKNPRKTAKLLWPLWLHKGTVHFYQIFASSIKECFCKQHTSSRNQNLGLQLAFALLQKHLEHSTHWITTQRKRIPWLNVFPLHLIRTAKEQATDKGPVDAHNKMHRLVYHLLSSTS